MKLSILLLTLFLAGCGTGKRAADGTMEAGSAVRGVSTLLAENPEMLRKTVIGLIGEGAGADAAREIIDRYEADLGFVQGERPSGATIADSATASPSSERIQRFLRNSLSVAMIGLNECYVNFNETGEDRCARRGLAHGYIALISNPSPAQKADVIQKMKFLQGSLLK